MVGGSMGPWESVPTTPPKGAGGGREWGTACGWARVRQVGAGRRVVSCAATSGHRCGIQTKGPFAAPA